MIVGFATKQVYPNISNIQTGKVKTGMGGSAGNKGAVIGRFDVYDTSIVLANVHFESGQSKIQDRVEQFQYVIENAFQNDTE